MNSLLFQRLRGVVCLVDDQHTLILLSTSGKGENSLPATAGATGDVTLAPICRRILIPKTTTATPYEGELSMKTIATSGALAQQAAAPAATPTEGIAVSAADLAAIVAKQPTDKNGFQSFMQLAPYNVNMEHRVNVPQSASVHDTEAELFYVVKGSATMVTGGKLLEGKQNGANWTGSGIEGGKETKLNTGDFLLVPEGVPHWFSKVDGDVTLMSLHLPRSK
jgi:mannose-6-phosphate isomerase-like protein (cupin superfamily)